MGSGELAAFQVRGHHAPVTRLRRSCASGRRSVRSSWATGHQDPTRRSGEPQAERAVAGPLAGGARTSAVDLGGSRLSRGSRCRRIFESSTLGSHRRGLAGCSARARKPRHSGDPRTLARDGSERAESSLGGAPRPSRSMDDHRGLARVRRSRPVEEFSTGVANPRVLPGWRDLFIIINNI